MSPLSWPWRLGGRPALAGDIAADRFVAAHAVAALDVVGRIADVPLVGHIAVAPFHRHLPLPQLLQRSPLLVLLEVLLLVRVLAHCRVPLAVELGMLEIDLVCDY